MSLMRLRTAVITLLFFCLFFLYGCDVPFKQPSDWSLGYSSKSDSHAFSSTQTNITGNTTNTANASLSIFFIDCGQGDSIYAELPCGKNILVDGGPGTEVSSVLKILKSRNVKKVDIVVATHPHEDHIGGLYDVLNKYDIGAIYMPAAVHPTQAFERLLDAIDVKGLEIDVPYPGEYILGDENDDFSILCVAPNSDSYANLNNYSIVLLFKYGERRILLAGDAEIESENEQLAYGYDIKADIIKLGHHGSRTSSSNKYLLAVSPSVAIVSCGKDNIYGHPHQEVLKRLKRLNVSIYQTDKHGTILVQTNGSDMLIKPIGG